MDADDETRRDETNEKSKEGDAKPEMRALIREPTRPARAVSEVTV